MVKRDEDGHLVLDKLWTFGCGVRWVTKIEEKEQIKSHSPNIIDLIEEGDYVNGSIVERAGEMLGFYSGGFFLGLKRIGIYSIVTKEQFDSMKYIVGGKEE